MQPWENKNESHLEILDIMKFCELKVKCQFSKISQYSCTHAHPHKPWKRYTISMTNCLQSKQNVELMFYHRGLFYNDYTGGH